MIFKDYNTFVNEDFATVGNVSGMGDVAAPTSDSVGSGDSWPSLFKPFSLFMKRKRKTKRKQRKAK